MNTWKWAAGYALVLVAAGVVVTYQLYFGPAQVRVRAQQRLAGVLRVPAKISGCEAGWGSITIGTVTAGSDDRISPNAFLEARNIRAHTVHGSQSPPSASSVGVSSSTDPASGAGVESDAQTDPEAEHIRVEVARGRLCVLHDFTDARTNPAESSAGRWDFERAINLTAAARALAATPARLYVDEGIVDIAERQVGGSRVWPVRVGRCRIETTGRQGLMARGRILPGPSHGSGDFVWEWTPDGKVVASGTLKGLRLPEAVPPLMPRVWVTAAKQLETRGVVDYVVERAVWVPRGSGSISGRIRHDASEIRLGGGVVVSDVEGEVELASHKLTYGTRAKPLSGEVLGAPVTVYGVASERGQRWRLDVNSMEMAALFVPVTQGKAGEAGVKRRWMHWVDALRPHGVISGHAELEEGSMGRWRGAMSWRECRFDVWPWLRGGAIEATWEEIEPGTVKGSVELKGIPVAGIGEMNGEVSARLAGGEVEAQFTQLAVQPDREGERTGTAFGSLRWNFTEGLQEISLRWLDLTLVQEGMRARGIRGEVSSTGPGQAVTGRMECAAATVSAGVFGRQPLELDQGGGGEFQLHADRVELRSLLFLGSQDALRVRGTLHYSGEVNLTVVIGAATVLGFRNSKLNASSLADWYKAAGPTVRAFRVTSRKGKWAAREISAGDPSLARTESG